MAQQGTAAPAVSVVALDELDEGGLDQLGEISRDLEVMRWVGDQKPWRADRVRELAKYSRDDRGADPRSRGYWSWAVRSAGRVMGFVGLHPWEKGSTELQLRFFVRRSEHRKGLGSSAVTLALGAYRSALRNVAGRKEKGDPKMPVYVWGLARKGNVASVGLFRKLGFESMGERKVGRSGEVEDCFRMRLFEEEASVGNKNKRCPDRGDAESQQPQQAAKKAKTEEEVKKDVEQKDK